MAYFTAFMALVQFTQENKNAKDTRELNQANAQLGREEDQEATRRAKKEMAKKEATARARSAASGIDATTGSPAAYMDELKKVHASEVAWMNKATVSRFNLASKGAQVKEQAAVTGAWGNLVQGASSAYKQGVDDGLFK